MRIKLLILLSIIINTVYSQVTLEWVKYNSGVSGSTTLNQFSRTNPAGNTRIAGTYINGTEIKGFSFGYNTSGTPTNTIWTTNFMTPTCYWIDDFFNTYLGGYYYRGQTKYIDIAKLSADGILWEVQDTLYGYGGNEAMDITSDNAGNTYMLRYKGIYFIYKYNLNGSCFKFPLSGIAEGAKIAIDSRNNDILLACYKTESRLGCLIRYDNSFSEKWETLFGVQGNVIKLIYTPSGKIFTLDDAYGITCFDTSGNIKWNYEIPGVSYDMVIDNDENPVVAASTTTIKFRSDSAKAIWTDKHPHYKLFSGRNNDVYALNTSDSSISVTKFSNTGAIFWNYNFKTPGNVIDAAASISVDSVSNVYVTGYSKNESGKTDGIVMKLIQSYTTVSGKVIINAGSSFAAGYVKAIQYNPTSDEIVTADSAVIQQNGTYILSHCPVENVYIIGFNKSVIVPTYFDTAIYWQYARMVYPTGNPDSININAKNITGPKGIYHISGAVSTPGPPPHMLKDAIVYAKLGYEFKGYCVTDFNMYGNLYIDSLPPGLYQLIAVRMGYETTVKEIYISNTNAIALISMKSVLAVSGESNTAPKNFCLYQNYPNPFNPSTTIQIEIPLSKGTRGMTPVSLKIYNVLGKEASVLVNEELTPGTYKVTWDASDFPSGVYFYNLIAGDYKESKKMVLMK